MGITLTTESKVYVKQHKAPCHDCPWRRNAIPGWLGPHPPEVWHRIAHSGAWVDCHTRAGSSSTPTGQWQCAGVAIYRANVIQRVEAPLLRLPKDVSKVFTFGEFVPYHKESKLQSWTAQQSRKQR